MSPRNQFFLTATVLTLVLGVALITFLVQDEEPAQVSQAMIDWDCAPWDGAAFTVSIPLEESVIRVSIYQTPDLKRPTTFKFPDKTLSKGYASLILQAGMPESLAGRVTFQHVEQDVPVEGRFDLVSQTGQEFEGRFKAEWGNEAIYWG